MLCPQCDLEFQEGEEFCPNCGAACNQIQNLLCHNKVKALPVGTIIGGRYRVENNSVDGMRRLYEAICLTTGKKVVIEEAELSPVNAVEQSDDSTRAQTISSDESTQSAISADCGYTLPMSLKERLELLNSLSNLQYPKVYDYFTSGDREYLVVEPPVGKNLASFVHENGLPEDAVLDIIIKLCQQVAEIHRLGYLHLNIEPHNIYYLPEGEVRLFDFSRFVKRGTIVKDCLTNEGFSPPELMLPVEATVDERSDIYSIGAVMLWMLSGEKASLLSAPRSNVMSSVLSPELARILLLCLAVDVNSRYRTVTELRDALEKYRAMTRASLRYCSASLTDIGMVRPNNEDACLSIEVSRCIGSHTDSYGIYLVADGMGGHAAGEIASAKAVEKIASCILDALNSQNGSRSFSQLVKDAIATANHEIYSMAQSSPGLSSMGTTVTLGLRVNNELYLGHVGDSRCYLVRDGKIARLTRDHSVVGGLLERGVITKEQARVHPDRGKIYRCLGSASEVSIDTCETTGYGEGLELRSGDKLVFCTDGMTSNVSDEEILECVKKRKDVNSICRDLVQLANVKGGEDNISVVVVEAIASTNSRYSNG